jgi:hypothetical protein
MMEALNRSVAGGRAVVLLTVLGLATIFAVLAIFTVPSDARDVPRDPRDDLSLWSWVGRR